MTMVDIYANLYCYIVPHSKQAKENVMHYKRAVEQGTGETHEQRKAKEEAVNTAAFTRGEYATLCRGNTSQVPVFSLSLSCDTKTSVVLTHQTKACGGAIRHNNKLKNDYSLMYLSLTFLLLRPDSDCHFLRSHSWFVTAKPF